MNLGSFLPITLFILIFPILGEDRIKQTEERSLRESIESKEHDKILKRLIRDPAYINYFSQRVNVNTPVFTKLANLIKEQNKSTGQFRYGLIKHFNSLPAQEVSQKKVMRELLIQALRSEFDMIEQNEFPTSEQIEHLCLYLDVVRKFKLKELMYDIVAYSAFPLQKVRVHCFKALAFMKDDRILPFIMKLASSENDVERTYAIEAFHYLKDERTIFVLLNALKDKNKSVRYYAMNTLSLLKRTEALPVFIKIIRSDVNDEIREKAIHVLGKFKPAKGFYAVMRALHDENFSIRKASLKTALSYEDPRAAYHISLQLAKEKDQRLKLGLIKGLLKIRSSGRTRGLSTTIKNHKETTKILRWAVYAAGELKDRLSLPPLLNLLEHEEADIRTEACVALGKYRDPRSVPRLVRILRDPNEKYLVQASALYSLKKMNHSKVIAQLREMSYDHVNPYLKAQIRELFFKSEPE